MKYLKQTMIVFGVTIGMILLIGLMQAFGWLYDSFGMWFTSIAMGITAVAIIVSFFGTKFNWRKIGFFVLHAGLILFLLGQLIYATTGLSVNASYSVNANNWYGQITVDGKNQDLGFTFQIQQMEVEYYDPIYDLYRVKDEKLVMSDVEVDAGGYCNFGKYGKVSAVSDDGSLKSQIRISSEYIASKRQPVKHYEGKILYSKPGKNVKTLTIEVNKTLRMGVYKVFLMNYNVSTRQVTMLFKKDFGEPLSVIGILMLMLGTLYTCLFERFVIKKVNRSLMLKAEAAKAAAAEAQSIDSESAGLDLERASDESKSQADALQGPDTKGGEGGL